MRFLVILFFFTGLQTMYGQNVPQLINKNDTINKMQVMLVGLWKDDSTNTTIEFFTSGRNLTLRQKKYYSFTFFTIDSFPLTGYSITWPPHDCYVKKIGEEHIEIQYNIFGLEPVSARFHKLK
jgi:hypothetical protein